MTSFIFWFHTVLWALLSMMMHVSPIFLRRHYDFGLSSVTLCFEYNVTPKSRNSQYLSTMSIIILIFAFFHFAFIDIRDAAEQYNYFKQWHCLDIIFTPRYFDVTNNEMTAIISMCSIFDMLQAALVAYARQAITSSKPIFDKACIRRSWWNSRPGRWPALIWKAKHQSASLICRSTLPFDFHALIFHHSRCHKIIWCGEGG